MGRPHEQLSQSQPQLIPEARQQHEQQHEEINADLVWHAAMMRRYPSEISVESSSSGSASTNTAFVDSKFTLVTLDRMDGHALRRRKRFRPAVYQNSSFFADDNSDSDSRPSPKAKAKTSKWLIPADHPYKICWDLCTVLVSFIGAYNAHSSIRDRSFHQTPRLLFCECWFLVDMILNFLTQHKSFDGRVLRDGKSVWARYLTTWFVIDVLSLLPWEVYYVKPIIEMQNRLNWFAKIFKRSKAVVRVTRVLRGRHFKLFGRVAKQTKHAGVGARRLLRLLIKYVPKYIFFWRRMKGVVVVRLLRMLRYIQRILKNIPTTKRDDGGDTHTDVTQDECEELEEDDSFDDLY